MTPKKRPPTLRKANFRLVSSRHRSLSGKRAISEALTTIVELLAP